jgi:hypothetical protein
MKIIIDPAAAGSKDYLIQSLKCILADEYMIMNKTSGFIRDCSSKNEKPDSKLLNDIYEDLKNNAAYINCVLKKKGERVFLSINDIISSTRLKKSQLPESRIASIEMLIEDHLSIIQHLEEAINDFAFTVENDCLILFKKLRDIHKKIIGKFKNYTKEIFTYKRVCYDQKPAK